MYPSRSCFVVLELAQALDRRAPADIVLIVDLQVNFIEKSWNTQWNREVRFHLRQQFTCTQGNCSRLCETKFPDENAHEH